MCTGMKTPERLWVNRNTGSIVQEGYPNSVEYIRTDAVDWNMSKYDAEHSINIMLRKKIAMMEKALEELNASRIHNDDVCMMHQAEGGEEGEKE